MYMDRESNVRLFSQSSLLVFFSDIAHASRSISHCVALDSIIAPLPCWLAESRLQRASGKCQLLSGICHDWTHYFNRLYILNISDRGVLIYNLKTRRLYSLDIRLLFHIYIYKLFNFNISKTFINYF